MSFTRFLAVAKKEIVQVLRDSRSLIIVLIMPVILVLLFGYGVNLDLKHLPIYVYGVMEASRARICSSAFRPVTISRSCVSSIAIATSRARSMTATQRWVLSFHGTFRSACAMAVQRPFRLWSTEPTTTRRTL